MMGRISALTQRELSASFFSPVAYVVAALFLATSGYFFTNQILTPGAEASPKPMLEGMAMLLVFAVPLLTMRAMSEEYATGTIETLMTAPVSDAEVVISKFLGALVFFTALLLTTLLHVILLFAYGSPDVGVVILGYIGMILLGGLYLSVGIFASALTRFQLVAAMIGMGVLGLFTIAVNEIAKQKIEWRGVLGYMNVLGHFENFSKGIFDTRSLIFFLSGTLFFLFLAIKIVESKRWR